MKKNFAMLLLAASLLSYPALVTGACRDPDLAKNSLPSFLGPKAAQAASGQIKIEWFGHSFFGIYSSRGTRVFTDPFGPIGYPMPDVSGHGVTIGREHGNHNNAGLIKGNPRILRGLTGFGGEWTRIQTAIKDILIYNVPIHQRGYPGHLKGSAFVFEVDGLCILHMGDVSDKFNQDQLELIGKVDIALTPIGGRFTMDADTAKEALKQVKPKIAVPMHYWNNIAALNRFAEGPYKVRVFKTNNFSVSKETLPKELEIYILKIAGFDLE